MMHEVGDRLGERCGYRVVHHAETVTLMHGSTYIQLDGGDAVCVSRGVGDRGRYSHHVLNWHRLGIELGYYVRLESSIEESLAQLLLEQKEYEIAVPVDQADYHYLAEVMYHCRDREEFRRVIRSIAQYAALTKGAFTGYLGNRELVGGYSYEVVRFGLHGFLLCAEQLADRFGVTDEYLQLIRTVRAASELL